MISFITNTLKRTSVVGFFCLLVSFPGSAATDEIELRRNEGFLLIDSDIGRKTINWKLSSTLTLESLPIGRTIQLLKLREGKYKWREIGIPHFDLPHQLDIEDDDRWAFTIERQKINYAGTLIVDEERSSDDVDVKFINRTAELLPMLKEKFPEHFARYGLIYTGKHQDAFLRLIGEDP